MEEIINVFKQYLGIKSEEEDITNCKEVGHGWISHDLYLDVSFNISSIYKETKVIQDPIDYESTIIYLVVLEYFKDQIDKIYGGDCTIVLLKNGCSIHFNHGF